jgi:uncharacterized membrane protein
MIFKFQKNKYLFAVIFGVIAFLTGLMFIILFIVKAIVERIGEADQSLLFWYLPVLIIGIIAAIPGAGFFIWGFINLRRKEKTFWKGINS